MVFLSPTSPIAPDLEPGHQPPELPQLLQDEDVCHPWGHPHGLWGVPQHLQPHVSAESCQWGMGSVLVGPGEFCDLSIPTGTLARHTGSC